MAFVTTILKVLVVLCITITLSSCGFFQNHRKIVDLPFEGEESQGRMVILKAQDRISYGKEFGAFCSEPSPDAISALASSISASALIDPGRKADLAIALQQSISSIGLRTQSIQLMRDALYRACEAFYSKALSKPLYYDLHKRYQDHMIAVLAIEQLTGVVKAPQMALSGTANALAASSTVEIQEVLADAKKIAETEKANLDALIVRIAANEEKQTQMSEEITNLAEQEESLKNEIKALEPSTQPPEDPDNETMEEAIATLAAKREELDGVIKELSQKKTTLTEIESMIALDKATLPGQKNTYDNAVLVQQSVEENLESSRRQAQAVASGASIFTGDQTRSNLDSVTVQSISTAVQEIATSAIERPRTSDVCLDILAAVAGVEKKLENNNDASLLSNRAPILSQDAKDILIKTCSEIILGEAK